MADFEKFTQIQSEIDENRDAYNKINKEYLDLVKLYGKCMAATDNAIENIVKLPTDSEGWKLWKNRLKTRRSLELTKFNQELILYDKRMEVFATFSKAFNRQYDPSQFQKINLLALKQADEIPDEVPDMRPTSPIEIISDESVNEIPHPYYWNDPNQMDIMQPTTSANAKAIYEAQKLNRKSQLPQSKLPQRPKTPKTSTVSTPRRSPPKFEDQLSSTTNNFKSTPKSKLRQPNFHSSKSPKFQSEIPRKAPSFNISCEFSVYITNFNFSSFSNFQQSIKNIKIIK